MYILSEDNHGRCSESDIKLRANTRKATANRRFVCKQHKTALQINLMTSSREREREGRVERGKDFGMLCIIYTWDKYWFILSACVLFPFLFLLRFSLIFYVLECSSYNCIFIFRLSLPFSLICDAIMAIWNYGNAFPRADVERRHCYAPSC